MYMEKYKEGEKLFQAMYTTKTTKHNDLKKDKQYNFKGDPPGKYGNKGAKSRPDYDPNSVVNEDAKPTKKTSPKKATSPKPKPPKNLSKT